MLRLIAYLFDFIFAVVIGRLLNRALRTFQGGTAPNASPRNTSGQQNVAGQSVATARDPVCGMFVSTEVSRRLTRGSETLHFCSQECLDRYQKKEAGI